MRLLIDDDSTCSKDRACAQQPDKTLFHIAAGIGQNRSEHHRGRDEKREAGS